MKRTEIKYQRISKNRVKILEIKNYSDGEDIETEFGKEIRHRYYWGGFPSYAGYKEEKTDTLQINAGHDKFLFLRSNYICDHKYFLDCITLLKEAGERFQRIKKKVQRNEIKTIII